MKFQAKLEASSPARQAAAALSLLACLVGTAPTASAASASGPSALALAAVVALHGSAVGAFDRRALSRLFGGNANFFIARVKKITVSADSIACKMSDVDITMRSCNIVVRRHNRRVTGRAANELFGTLAIAGVAPEGAAGSSSVSLMHLECTIDPMAIKQKAGGGADCIFDTGSEAK